jgi:hypothetical protein
MEALQNLTVLFNMKVNFAVSFSFATHKSRNFLLVSFFKWVLYTQAIYTHSLLPTVIIQYMVHSMQLPGSLQEYKI